VAESSKIAAIYDAAKSSKEVIVVTHISPDADAVGSSLGLALLLEKNGIEANCFFSEKLPVKLLSLVDKNRVFFAEDELIEKLNNGALLIGVDCATKKRLGEVVYKNFSLAKATINIDHHASNENWGELNWVVPDAAATAEMIFGFSNSLSLKLNSDIANLLYAGILDDTGSFCFSNTSGKTLRVSADLIDAGANPAEISNNLYFQVPEKVWRLRSKSLLTLRLEHQGRVGLMFVTQEMLNETGCLSEDTEGLVDIIRSIQGVEVAFFVREIENGFKVSARSKNPEIDVNSFASFFGGGGHKAAAGFTIVDNLDTALDLITKKSKDILV